MIPINFMFLQLLNQLCTMGSDQQLIAFHPYDKSKPSNKQTTTEALQPAASAVDDPMSDEDMEEDFGAIVSRKVEESVEKLEDQTIAK